MFRSIQFQSDKGLGRVALAAFGLGAFMALHLSALLLTLFALSGAQNWPQEGGNSWSTTALDRWGCALRWCLYALALGVFHMSEFLLTASFRPSIVSYESFLLNHSREYHIALLFSAVEFWIEVAFVPHWKLEAWVLALGLVIVVVGQWFRIAAMYTAASNFSHRIEYMKRQEHVLVTHGVYRYVRHPSYLGWFLWTVGSQVLLANPIAVLVYTVVAWGFFRDRIPYEEQLLLGFFPDEYPTYRARTISGIPFV